MFLFLFSLSKWLSLVIYSPWRCIGKDNMALGCGTDPPDNHHTVQTDIADCDLYEYSNTVHDDEIP